MPRASSKNKIRTRMHCSRMRTARLHIVPGGEGGVVTWPCGGGRCCDLVLGGREVLLPGPGGGGGRCCDLVPGRGGGVVTWSWGGGVLTWSRAGGRYFYLVLWGGRCCDLVLGVGGRCYDLVPEGEGRGGRCCDLVLGGGGGRCCDLVHGCPPPPLELDRQTPVKL